MDLFAKECGLLDLSKGDLCIVRRKPHRSVHVITHSGYDRWGFSTQIPLIETTQPDRSENPRQKDELKPLKNFDVNLYYSLTVRA